MLVSVAYAIVFAVLLSALLVGLFGWRYPGREEPWPAVLFFFLVLFLATWAAGLWVSPVVVGAGGGYWLTFFVIAVLLALLLAATAPPRRPPRTAREAAEEAQSAAAAQAVFGVFFWILILGLIAVIVIRLLRA